MTPLLDSINSPLQLKALNRKQLKSLALELRAFIVDSVAKTGGHLASNLGVVELTVALHYVFNTPDDKLVWDVGHQTYPHKILTGRREAMANLRKAKGIAGFPRRNESEYDAFGTGHSSTSISAALGMAVAAQKAGLERRAVAIIGDGAMTAGMAFEGLNNAGSMDANLLVILNDNDMSISNNVGALNNYLSKLLSSRFYGSIKKSGKKILSNPGFGGQSFIPHTLKKIAAVRKLIDESGRDIMLQVDGGVKVDNIREIAATGADTFVAGSAIFGKPDYKAVIDAMRGELALVG